MPKSRILFCVLGAVVALSSVPALGQEATSAEPPKQAGSEVPTPKRTKTVPPAYPAEAQAQGLRGIVILELVIDTDGKVASVDVVRSIPPFDEAALSAVRQWEYEVTKLDGKPVRVRMTVPISFALRLPEMKRQEGIPELRQGAAPQYPQAGQGGATVVAQVTLDSEGRVGEAEVRSGDTPWAEALMQALRTWRFNLPTGRGTVSFRVEAEFMPPSGGQPARVGLELKGLQESESFASQTPAPASTGQPAPPTSPAPAEPASSPPAIEPAPQPSPAEPSASRPEPSPAEPSASRPEPSPSVAPPPATTAPAPVPPQETAPRTPAPAPPATMAAPPALPPASPPASMPGQPAPQPEPPPATTAPAGDAAPPPVETISAPPPPAPPGVSALPNVMLGAGVPDLVRGRRPVPPPLARMAGTTGTVEVRFSVDAAGQATLKSSEGPDLLKPAADEAVRTWSFRRTTTDRLHMVASFSYSNDGATVLVNLEP